MLLSALLTELLLLEVKQIALRLKNVNNDDISPTSSYPELEIAEPTGYMVKYWMDV